MASTRRLGSVPKAGWPGSLQSPDSGSLAHFVADDALRLGTDWTGLSTEHATVVAPGLLQDVADYRGALQAWFQAVRLDGHLIVTVPHAFLYERQLQLPSRWRPAQRRLYTPRSLLEEVEEALVPNSYRVRLLEDRDAGYRYDGSGELEPEGEAGITLVLQKIAAPPWRLDAHLSVAEAGTPAYAFDPPRTRVELTGSATVRKVLILKLDHLGDFIMGVAALERARAAFADAEITLVVGSWNAQMARELGVADHVIAFDAFPRNSTEEEVDVPGTTAVFRAAVPGEYDLAIDMRSDKDTRVLLKNVRARLRAAIGTRAEFPWLDIFLPLDWTRNEPETAAEYHFGHASFSWQGSVINEAHRLISRADRAERDCAIVWGPYRRLRPGRYFFEPFIELDNASDGLLRMDIGLDARPMSYVTVPPLGITRLPFTIEKPGTQFEFRIWTVEGMPSVDFSFFGGRLIREGAASVLHQSEYGQLLIELIKARLERTGLLEDIGAP